MADAAHTARATWTLFEPIHAVTYFAPEARGAFEEAGLRGFWRGYFAGRAGALGPVGAAAGIAGFFSQRMAKTALPLASATIVANGLQGVFLQARGISQKPGGWSNARYNMEMGPPLLAPLLVTMVGGMGLLAAILRREK